MSAVTNTFDRICSRPSMFGDPAQVETGLWVCMSIWAQEQCIPEGKLYEAIKTVREQVPELHDKAGLSFHNLCSSRLDYTPVVVNMRNAFALLMRLPVTHTPRDPATQTLRDFGKHYPPDHPKHVHVDCCKYKGLPRAGI